MVKFSDHRKPESTVRLDLVRVALWFHPDDSNVEYYELPSTTIKQIIEFVETGEVDPEIRDNLQAALTDFPAWSELSIDGNLSKEQRESAAGRLVLAKGRRVSLEYSLDLGVTVY